MARHFNKLPSNIGEQLLLKLADKHAAAGIVSYIIEEDSKNLREDIRKEILAKLKEKGIM